MNDEKRMTAQAVDIIPGEPETGSSVSVNDGNPEEQLAILEKRAHLAPRFKKAIETILITQTYPKDWTVQGDGDKARACLSSAGAERVGRNFPIRFYDVKHSREDFSDSRGAGYRYVFQGYASLGDRIAYAEGNYSTRDEFLGKANGSFRPMEDVNEGDVRSAAMHIFQGNAVKQLLGLRGLPVAEYNRIMGESGQDASQAAQVRRGQGAEGGTSSDDSAKQKELGEAILYIVRGGFGVERDAKGFYHAKLLTEPDPRKDIEKAAEMCITLTSFKATDGKEVKGKALKDLTGKWLANTLKNALRIKGEVDKAVDQA